MNIVKKVRKIVEDQSRSGANIFDVTGYIHVCKVVSNAQKLAQLRNVDLEMSAIAAWLHDYATFVDKNYVEIHDEKGAEFAERILNELNYPKEKIAIIKDAIYCHRGSKNLPKKTELARLLADADAMAHFEAVPSLFYLAYVTYKIKLVEEAKKFVKEKLARSWQKISPDARKLIQAQHDAAEIILEGKI